MKQIRTLLLTLFLTVLPATAVFGQTGNQAYPFDMSVQVVPPFNTNLYDLIPANRFRIAVMMRDMRYSDYEFIIEMKVYDITGSSPRFTLRSALPITVGSTGINRALSHDELRSIFKHNRENGEFSEGAYRLVFQALDAYKYIPISREYQQIAYLEEGAPPRLLRPSDGAKILNLQENPTAAENIEEIAITEIHSPLGINFSWIMPYYFPAGSAPNEYELKIYEVGKNANPNAAAQSSNPIYTNRTFGTIEFVPNTAGTFLNSAGQLEDGQRYAWQVCLVNPVTLADQAIAVKNRGCSEVYSFTYGTEVFEHPEEYKPTPRTGQNYEDLPDIEITHVPDTFSIGDHDVCWKTVDPARMNEYDGYRVEIRIKTSTKEEKKDKSEGEDEAGEEDRNPNGIIFDAGKGEGELNDCNDTEGWTQINGDDRRVIIPPTENSDTGESSENSTGSITGESSDGSEVIIVEDPYVLCRTLSNLQYRTTYEVRIQGYKITSTEDDITQNDIAYGKCDIREFWISDTIDNKCGDPLVPLKSATAKTGVKTGDRFSANGYEVIIDSLAPNTGETYTGTGYIRFPFVSIYSLKVKFENIKINDENELLEGTVVTEYNKSKELVLDLNRLLGSGYGGGSQDNVAEPAYSDEGNKTLETAANEKTNGDWFTITEDGKTNMYIKNADGTAQKIGTVETKAFNNNNSIDAGAKVEFSSTDASILFDNDKFEFRNSGVINCYTDMGSISKPYIIPWVAMNPGRTGTLDATIKSGNPTNIEYIIVLDENEGKVLVLDTPADGKVTIPGSATAQETTEVLAIANVPGKDDKQVVGKLNIANYAPQERKLVLVPTGYRAPSINGTSIKNQLDAIYKPLGITFTVEVDESFGSEEEFDLSGMTDKSFWGNESDEMKRIRLMYKTQRPNKIVNDKAYLFVIGVNSDFQVQGDMPRGKSVGYIFEKNGNFDDGRLVAHELAHGIFKLEHVFSGVYGITQQGQTNNLLDYTTGEDNRHLMYWQWQAIRNGQLTWNFLEGDEASQSIFTPIGIVEQLHEENSKDVVASLTLNLTNDNKRDFTCLATNVSFIVKQFTNGREHDEMRDGMYPTLTVNPSILTKREEGLPPVVNTIYTFYQVGLPAFDQNNYFEISVNSKNAPLFEHYVFGKELTLTVADIAATRTRIAAITDSIEREDLYLELQKTVPYHNQRDNEILGDQYDNGYSTYTDDREGKTIGDVMCNLTSQAMCLEMLGVGIEDACPDSEFTQLEDCLEQIKRDLGYGKVGSNNAREYGYIRQAIANSLNLNIQQDNVSNPNMEKSNLKPYIENLLKQGYGVMFSLKGHLVRCEGVTEDYLIIDDPYGKQQQLCPRKWGGQTNGKTSSIGQLGENSQWKWDDLCTCQISYIEWYYIDE
ncbi:MAG: hypothetical protein LBR52_06035 [Prevotellaceae bacterium]|jgi:hypothetical protein|nr:hypothetical protein [Prevotellaceae bacterium]